MNVTVPGRGGRSTRPRILIHRAAIRPGDASSKNGIPVTSPARTVIDLADSRERRPLERVIDEAAYLNLDLTGLVPRHGRRGAGVLGDVMSEHHPGTTLTRSHLEELFLAFCKRYDLPQPLVNTHIQGYEVDFAWPEQRLIVETDGHAAHGSRAAFERDRLKDADLITAGWRVLRVTYRSLVSRPAAVARQLRRLLG